MLCDIVETDGRPWQCCPRGFLREALGELESELGARVLASFEHEFQLLRRAAAGAAVHARRAAPRRAVAAELMGALIKAGVEPERFFAEYAPHQFEIPVAPAEGLASADRAVVLKEVVREVARRHGMRASFTPLADPEQAGNGVHIHLSLLDADGKPLLYDADGPRA